MLSILRVCLVFALLLHTDWTIANEPNLLQSLTVSSDHMKQSRHVTVFLPKSYFQANRRYPVLYLTDGDIQGPHTHGTLDFLSKFDFVPEMIVVGITNPPESRQRELTLSNGNSDESSEDEAGSSEQFLNFVEHELIPFIKTKYRTLDYQALSGTSHGGQFSINAWVNRPGLFDGVIAISPSLYWNDNQLILKASRVLEKQMLPGRLYLSVANEPEIMTSAFDDFVTLIQSHPTTGRHVKSAIFNNETHDSTTLVAQYNGIKFLFSEWVLPSTPQTLEDLQMRYQLRSKLIGSEQAIPEDRANGYGQWLQYLDRQDDAIELLKWNRDTYSQSINAHFGLINVYRHFGLEELTNQAISMALNTLENLSEADKDRLTSLLQPD